MSDHESQGTSQQWTEDEDRKLLEAAEWPTYTLGSIKRAYFPYRSYDSVRNRFRRLLHKGLAQERPEPEANRDHGEDPSQEDRPYEWKQSGDTAECSFVTDRPIKTEQDILEAGNIDRNRWRVDKFELGSWTTPMKKLGDSAVIQNYKVKATLRRVHPSEDYEGIREGMVEAITRHTPKHWTPRNTGGGSVLFEISPFDLHLGKYARGEETGMDYDSDVAEHRLKKAVDLLLSRASAAFGIGRILLPIGNDFFHYDSLDQATTNGTVQDADRMWQDNFVQGRQIMVDVIDTLSSVAPVDVLVIPGNHDRQRAFYLGEALYCWYYNVPHVDVDNSPSLRKYYMWGINLLGFTHGDKEKHNSLPNIMSNECRKWWADAEVCEWHIGHTHQKKEVKYNAGDTYDGTTVRTLPSLSGTDSWHHRMGYIGNVKACQSFVWDAEEGQIGSFETKVRE